MGWTLPIRRRSTPESSTLFEDIRSNVEARLGKIPFSGRYHRGPRRLEDDYVVCEKVLGSGMNGQVRLATSVSQPGQRFAVKSFQLEGIEQRELDSIASEVGIYLSLDHPHIARLFDVYESKKQLHLVMECMEGGELFDKVVSKKDKRFSEDEARFALRQMLLALNYLHSHGFVHRDVKLENFVYDAQDSDHLKLIDFGFSKKWDASRSKMSQALGSAAYVAPEVMNRNYTSQCDMWSLGVVGFILIGGYMPFSGKEVAAKRGMYTMKPEKWDGISAEGRDFIRSMLEVNPAQRLTAQQALEHPWILGKALPTPDGMEGVVEDLRQFSCLSKNQQLCRQMVAWSIPNKEQAAVRDHFLSLDVTQQGTITLVELREAMSKRLDACHQQEIIPVFDSLDYNHDQEVHYSDFLAAVLDTQVCLSDGLLAFAFRRFDTDASGCITVSNLGHFMDEETAEAFVQEIGQTKDGCVYFADFAAYLRGADPANENEKENATENAQEISKAYAAPSSSRRPKPFRSALRNLRSWLTPMIEFDFLNGTMPSETQDSFLTLWTPGTY